MDDNPDKRIVYEKKATETGLTHSFRIERKYDNPTATIFKTMNEMGAEREN